MLGGVLALVLGACASVSPPVQEMSDARQAIAAAREADAGKYAPAQLTKAAESVRSAERHIERHAYAAARRDAETAKSLATEARLVAEAQSLKQPRDTERPLK